MEHVKQFEPDRLAPFHKLYVRQALMEALAINTSSYTADEETLIHWYIAEVLTAASTRQQLYHMLHKPLHQFVGAFVKNPQEDEPSEAFELKQGHAEAMEYINIRLTEKLLEE